MDDELRSTLARFERKQDEQWEKMGDMAETMSGIRTDVAVMSERQVSQEARLVKVESRSWPPKGMAKDNDLSTKQILAIIGGIVALLGGGGGFVVTQQVDKAKDEVVKRTTEQEDAQREALAIMAKAVGQASKAQSAGAEAMATLDPEVAEEARKAAREAALEALRAERALRRESTVIHAEELQP